MWAFLSVVAILLAAIFRNPKALFSEEVAKLLEDGALAIL